MVSNSPNLKGLLQRENLKSYFLSENCAQNTFQRLCGLFGDLLSVTSFFQAVLPTLTLKKKFLERDKPCSKISFNSSYKEHDVRICPSLSGSSVILGRKNGLSDLNFVSPAIQISDEKRFTGHTTLQKINNILDDGYVLEGSKSSWQQKISKNVVEITLCMFS